jgi:hypothetical protein
VNRRPTTILHEHLQSTCGDTNFLQRNILKIVTLNWKRNKSHIKRALIMHEGGIPEHHLVYGNCMKSEAIPVTGCGGLHTTGKALNKH